MRITRMRALAALAAVLALALAAGGALAVGKNAKLSAAAAADEVIYACRHPNGGWVRIVSVAERLPGPRAGGVLERRRAEGRPGPAGPPGRRAIRARA